MRSICSWPQLYIFTFENPIERHGYSAGSGLAWEGLAFEDVFIVIMILSIPVLDNSFSVTHWRCIHSYGGLHHFCFRIGKQFIRFRAQWANSQLGSAMLLLIAPIRNAFQD